MQRGDHRGLHRHSDTNTWRVTIPVPAAQNHPFPYQDLVVAEMHSHQPYRHRYRLQNVCMAVHVGEYRCINTHPMELHC